MKMLLTFLMLTIVAQAQDLSNPELDYYREAPINEDEYNSHELEEIQKQEEESPYFEEYEEDDFVDEEHELQKLEEEYVE